MKRFTFAKKEKLKSKILIDKLFTEGKAVTVYPLRIVYNPEVFEDEVTFKATVSVSKKLHKKAVTRNRIKRLMREAYRTQKLNYFNKSETQYALMILYLSKDIPNFNLVEEKMEKLLKKFEEATIKTRTHEV